MSNVLVVEDDPTLRWLMAEAVEHLGYGVTECASADEALGVLERAKSFALLITDVRMPGSIDGLGLAKIVWLTRPDLPVLIISGHTELPPGFLPANSRFLKKPCTIDGLSSTIKILLSPNER